MKEIPTWITKIEGLIEEAKKEECAIKESYFGLFC